MADISMCLDNFCPSANSCKRHALSGTVASFPMQSYMDFRRGEGLKQCDDYQPYKFRSNVENTSGG